MSIILKFITFSLPETLSVKAIIIAKAEATHHLFKLEPTSTNALDRAELANVASEPELEKYKLYIWSTYIYFLTRLT